MKKLSIPALSCAVLFVMLGSCSKYEELNPVEPQNEETQSWASAHRSLEKAVYDEQTGSWVLPQADPYALGNFQKAYDNLSSGKSISNRGDKKALKEFSIPRTLQATHYTLKVFPRDEIELGKLEVMEGVKISYWPFDYVLLSKEESEKLDSSKGEKGASAVLKDQRRYTVTYTDLQTTDGPVPDESFVMPVLYAVWPCDKPLPVELDHEITGEVFLPAALFDENSKSWSTSGNSKEGEAMSIEALELIHNEAIALALPEMAITRADPMPPIRMVFLKAVQADTHTADLEPMANLRIVIQLGSRVWDNKYTDSEGRLALMVGTNLLASSIPYEATMRHQFHYPGRWKITVGGSPNSESALTIIQDETMAYRWPAGSPAEFLYTYSDSEHYATIHRAVNYFYFGDHLVPKEVYDDGIKIVAMGESNSEANGMFYYVRPFQKAYIRMYNNNTLNHPMKIGSTLHELGHMAQYNRNTFTGYLTTSNLLLESWASYVGWYVGEAYYTSLGWVKPPETDYSNITNQSRQFWMSTNDNYSPMFVDLIDGYNQRARGTTYPNDNISVTNNSVHSQILYVADHILGLSGALDYLQSNVDCNKTDLSTYLSSYR